LAGSAKPRRALLAWEAGAGGSHNARMVTLANTLKRRGFSIDFASLRPHEIREPLHSVERLLQAPVVPRMSRTGIPWTPKPVRSYSDVLQYLGLDTPIVVRRQLEAWRSIFDLVRPDVVVCDYSPLAALAARNRLPAVAFGCAFTAPCGSDGRFPPFAPNPPSEIEDEISLLCSINAALDELGEPAVPDLPSACVPPHNFAYGFSEIDPYAAIRRHELLPSVVEQCVSPPGGGREVALFLSKDLKNDPTVIQTLVALKLPLRIDDRDLEPETRRVLEQSGAKIEPRLVDTNDMAKFAAVAVTHGGSHSVSRALVAGVPQVILAASPENWFYVNVIERLGIGKGTGRRSQLLDTVNQVVLDPGYGERARALAIDCRRRHLGNTFEMVADRIAQTL
jgi:hypothetical protein